MMKEKEEITKGLSVGLPPQFSRDDFPVRENKLFNFDPNYSGLGVMKPTTLTDLFISQYMDD